MRKFNEIASIDEIKKKTKERRLWFDQEAFDRGHDFIRFGWVSKKTGFGFIAYYPMDGSFYVYDKDNNCIATNKSEELENEPWYDEILNFVYYDEVKEGD